MGYQVKDEIKSALAKLKTNEAVKKTLDFIKEDEAFTLGEQKEITLVEAPTFHEAGRAKLVEQKFKEYGLSDVHLDRHGNVVGYRPGEKGEDYVLVDAHLDTVFPFGSAKEITEKDGKLFCPGISDDTRGLAAILGAARALQKSGIKTKKGIMFTATVQEEGMGGLNGSKRFFQDNDDIAAAICIDGADPSGIVYEATGIRTIAVTYKGIGGHASGDYGLVANPLHAAARAVTKIAEFKLTADPRTTIAVSNFHAGNDAAIHAIVNTATIKINFRSNGAQELKDLEVKVRKAIDEAAKEETAFWGKDTISYEIEDYVDVPAGTQSPDSPMVQSIYEIIKENGLEPLFERGGSTNANNPIGKGVPAVCLGGGGHCGGVHTLGEYYEPADAHKGVQNIFLLALMLGGIDGQQDSVL